MKPLCLISGGTSGVGFETAKALARRYRLALIYKSDHAKAQAALAQLCEQEKDGQAIFSGDLSTVEGAGQVVREIEAWDNRAPLVLINCAGRSLNSIFVKDSIESQLKFVNENLMTCMILTHFVVNKMYLQRKGCIINISSLSAERSFLGTTAYATAKAGIEVFTKNLSREVYHAGIRVNCVRPGLFRSPMTDQQIDHIQRLQHQLISIDAVVACIDYLLDPRSESVSGSVIPVIQEGSRS